MQNTIVEHASLRNALLADALIETVAELRLIEAGDMIGYIRGGQWPNIADLVQSSSELSFRDGSLSFACSGEFTVGWDEPIAISLEMEFLTATVSAFFTLTLAAGESLVDIRHVWFASPPGDEATGTGLLAEALADARLSTPWIVLGSRDGR